MPSSEGANIRRRRGLARGIAERAVRAAKLCAVVAVLSLIGLGDAAFGADEGAIATIAIQPAAARLLVGARLAPVVSEGAGFILEARSIASKSRLFHATSHGMSARFPADAAGRVELGVAGVARRAFVRRVGAGSARGHLARGALVYDEAAPGIDSAWLARGDDVEELIVVREGAAAIAYDLELPEGSTLEAPPGFPGLVEVHDGRGSAWLRMTADAAWDARGRPVPIAVRVDGARDATLLCCLRQAQAPVVSMLRPGGAVRFVLVFSADPAQRHINVERTAASRRGGGPEALALVQSAFSE